VIAGYELSDFLAWDAATWDRLLSAYHMAIWPAQLVAVFLFVAVLWFAIKSNHRFAALPLILVLATCWAWVGWLFHAQYHAQLNWAAHYWVAACLAQAFLMLVLTTRAPKLSNTPAASVGLIACFALPLWLPALIGALWGQSLSALSWPLVSPDALAWLTLIALTFFVFTGGSRFIGLLMIIPSLLLMLDGLIAYSLPAYDRLTIVALAGVSIAFVVVRLANRSVNPRA